MSYQFPGMNPWLEDYHVWKDVHSRLISAIRDSLAEVLAPRYFVGIDIHTYISASPLLNDNVEEAYLEIQLVPSREVVTVIELLSHTNKQSGRDRTSYLKKRQAFLDANVNFVEIDPLRSHQAMPHMEQAERMHYRIFSRRREEMQQALLYAFNVRDTIPVFPIPLQPDDQEPSLDLGKLVVVHAP